MQGDNAHSLATLRRDLTALLVRPGYSQERIAAEAGVDQPAVSRAKNGELRRITPRISRICAYVEKELRDVAVPPSVLRAAKAYIGSGGDPELLCESIDLLMAAGRPARRTVAE